MIEQSQQGQHGPVGRRGVLLGAGIAGVGAVLAGCSTAPVPYDANEAGVAPGAAVAPTQSPTAAAAGPATQGPATQGQATQGQSTQGQEGQGQSAAPGGGAATGTLLGSVTDIPVGGGMIYAAEKVVVTQPAKGVFRAFSAVCTHVGCVCNKVVNGTIDCPCHGSEFRISDGAVVTGPAPSPLPTRTITVSEDKIMLQ
jgi:Rieske Fe-S protein